MDFNDIIRHRRAVSPASFNEKKVSRAQLMTILEHANFAPTHKRSQPWRFKIFEGESRQQLANFLSETYLANTAEAEISEIKLKKMRENPLRASVAIAICMSPNPTLPEWEEVAAVAMAVQNMWLTCQKLGINGFWSTPKLAEYAGDFLNLGEQEKCLGFFYIGFSDVPPALPTRKPIEDLIEWKM
ncbi:MAG: hypothetical protein RL757_2570 [Bacteroidota bacterium]|jgi:nitroreductase